MVRPVVVRNWPAVLLHRCLWLLLSLASAVGCAGALVVSLRDGQWSQAIGVGIALLLAVPILGVNVWALRLVVANRPGHQPPSPTPVDPSA